MCVRALVCVYRHGYIKCNIIKKINMDYFN